MADKIESTQNKNSINAYSVIKGVFILLLGIFLLWGFIETTSSIGSLSKSIIQFIASLFAFLGLSVSSAISLILAILCILLGLGKLLVLPLSRGLEKIALWHSVKKRAEGISICIDAFFYSILLWLFQYVWTYFLINQIFFRKIYFYLPVGFLVLYLYLSKKHKPVLNMLGPVLLLELAIFLTIEFIT